MTAPQSNATNTTTNTTVTAASHHHIPYLQNSTKNKIKHSINKSKTSPVGNKQQRHSAAAVAAAAAAVGANVIAAPITAPAATATANVAAAATATVGCYNTNLFFCDDIDASAVQDLSVRLLDELRAAKSRHLTCTEVSLPCDLTTRVAAEIITVSEKEPCGIRGCTIYIEFEDEPQNSRRIASLKIDPETVSTFEVYLTLRQDHRGWTALLPQFMKSLARSTITISPEFTITKHKLYTQQSRSSNRSYSRQCSPIATPSS